MAPRRSSLVPSGGSPLVHIGMKVPEDLAAGIKARADAEDRTVSAEIRRALRAHLATTSNAPAAVNGEGVKDAEAAAHDSES